MTYEWHLGDFMEMVKTKIGGADLEAALPALESIPEKIRYARFHSDRALEILGLYKPNIADRAAQTAAAMSMIINQDQAEMDKFGRAVFEATAHSVAYAQCLHSTADYLAKVIYRGLALERRNSIHIAETQIGLRKISDKIAVLPDMSEIKAAIDQYIGSNAFRYLSAFVNTEKHHEMIDSSFSLSFSAESAASAGLRFRSFKYSGSEFGQRWAFDVFETDFKSLLDFTAQIGVEMNGYLKRLYCLTSR